MKYIVQSLIETRHPDTHIAWLQFTSEDLLKILIPLTFFFFFFKIATNVSAISESYTDNLRCETDEQNVCKSHLRIPHEGFQDDGHQQERS